MNPLMNVPGLAGYLQRRQMLQGEESGELQQAQAATGLMAALEKRKQEQALRQSLAESGGDVEKAIELAVKSGNVDAAQRLAPLAKMAQEKREREETRKGLAGIFAPQQQPEASPMAPGGASVMAPQGQAPQPVAPDAARTTRVEALKKMSLLYANNPPVMAALQREIDKLEAVKPMIEHNFSIGGDQVQPHISRDEGRTWAPLPGSKPSAKFAKQVLSLDTGAQVPITDDTLEMDAWRYLTDGTLPPNMGRGIQGTQQATKIRNLSAKLAKDMGMAPDEIRFAQLNSKTQVQAIGQLARARAQILQFEKTAEYNADLALNASRDVWRTGSPWVNRPLQYLRSEGLGDPKTKVFNAANETFVSEYARVMSGGYGAAQTTEGAQTRAHTLLSTATAPEQYEAVVKQLKIEMKNRVKALNDQMDEERQRLRSGVVRTPTPAAPAPTPAGPSVESLLEKYK